MHPKRGKDGPLQLVGGGHRAIAHGQGAPIPETHPIYLRQGGSTSASASISFRVLLEALACTLLYPHILGLASIQQTAGDWPHNVQPKKRKAS